jgi:aminomethyltransferase
MGAVVVRGPGVVECLQGMLTADVESSGERGFVYGAVLTPKGMIVCDLWLARDDDAVMLYPSPKGSPALVEAFGRSLPPRLARYGDRTAEIVVLRAVGPEVLDRLDDGGVPIPDPGRTQRATVGGAQCLVARPLHDLPFTLQLSCGAPDEDEVLGVLESCGLTPTVEAALELRRIEAGWPRLGSEIDQKTLPQEVRYEELEGVSYTKGCYTGQETVARVHFRGHTNRRLLGLQWEGDPDISDPTIRRGEKVVGRVTSVVWVESLGQYAGLGMLRREVKPGAIITAAGGAALATSLPLQFTA